ncbi:hypothetical protein [Oceanobacter kriegii]|uniref:hypothetical protein n=1 Tax=Oceanobacter kriegii TaxID=64972 RepID=UPI000412E50C|nr:hypothetical protein [Oceanobacter kriegii]
MMTIKNATRLVTGAAFALASTAALAVGTPAGTDITNTATATYDLPGGATGLTKSSQVELTVLELINVNVTSQNSGSVSTTAGATDQVLTFVVTNTGNGVEDFVLEAVNASGDAFDMSNVRIYIDTDGNGTFNSADTEIASGTGSIGLAADEDATLFIVADTPSTGDGGAALVQDDLSQLTLTALSETVDEHGDTTPTAGELISGVGSGGAPDAVIGTSYTDDANGSLQIGTGGGTATVEITKSIVSTVDPFGGSTRVPGSIVTYQIDVEVVNGTVDSLVVSDELPASMEYVEGTLVLDSAALTDADDTDAGDFDDATGVSGTVNVDLGTRNDGDTFVIQLQAEIK